MQNTIFHPSLSPLSEAFPSLLSCHHIGPLGPQNNIRVRYPISPPSPALFRDPFHKDLLKQEVPPLLNLGAVEMVPEGFKGKGFYSHYFLTPKRMEAYLRPPQIESVSLKMIQNGYPSFNNTCVKEERQFAALDLQDAYSHILFTLHTDDSCVSWWEQIITNIKCCHSAFLLHPEYFQRCWLLSAKVGHNRLSLSFVI